MVSGSGTDITPNTPNVISGAPSNATTASPPLSYSTSPETHEHDESIEAKEVALRTLELGNASSSSQSAPTTFETTPALSFINERPSQVTYRSMPPNQVATTSTNAHPITIQTSGIFSIDDLPLQDSTIMSLRNKPQSLFVLALSKLYDAPITLAALKRLTNMAAQVRTSNNNIPFLMNRKSISSEDIQAPDSLTSAPPSYSFVLRQMAARRRPRLMGTFIPSPSFVQHTPPPNYAAAFDIYVDNPMPPPPPRTVNFGFMPMPAVCPECGYTGLTVVKSKITLCTHLCAFILCLFCCWLCAPLPYLLRSCKDVYHYCRNCRFFLGMYCPTNPDNAYNT